MRHDCHRRNTRGRPHRRWHASHRRRSRVEYQRVTVGRRLWGRRHDLHREQPHTIPTCARVRALGQHNLVGIHHRRRGRGCRPGCRLVGRRRAGRRRVSDSGIGCRRWRHQSGGHLGSLHPATQGLHRCHGGRRQNTRRRLIDIHSRWAERGLEYKGRRCWQIAVGNSRMQSVCATSIAT